LSCAPSVAVVSNLQAAILSPCGRGLGLGSLLVGCTSNWPPHQSAKPTASPQGEAPRSDDEVASYSLGLLLVCTRNWAGGAWPRPYRIRSCYCRGEAMPRPHHWRVQVKRLLGHGRTHRCAPTWKACLFCRGGIHPARCTQASREAFRRPAV